MRTKKIEILRRERLAATTVKFSTNGLPKLRSGLLHEKEEGPPDLSLQFKLRQVFIHRFASVKRSSLAG